eukprot:15452049-Alexandrium_andersonii.AAC.1
MACCSFLGPLDHPLLPRGATTPPPGLQARPCLARASAVRSAVERLHFRALLFGVLKFVHNGRGALAWLSRFCLGVLTFARV